MKYIGTHIDEVNKYELPIEKLKQRYPQIAGFYFVSSVSGAGINDLAKAIVDVALKEKYMVKKFKNRYNFNILLIENNKKGEKIPLAWLQFEEALKQMKKEKNILDYAQSCQSWHF